MDLDHFLVANRGWWERLSALSAKATKPRARLTVGETDELVALYERAGAQLSHARAYYDDPGLTAQLTTLVATAGGAIHRAGPSQRAGAAVFFTEAFPGAVWQIRHLIAIAALCLLVPMVAIGLWLSGSEQALDVTIPQWQQEALIESEFEDYYSSGPAEAFSARVFFNNVQVSFLALAVGIFGGVGTIALLIYNGLNIGLPMGLFLHEGQGGKFFGLILPHGILELTAVVVAGGAGLAIGWALIRPGDRTRLEALAQEGRRAATVVLGLILCFAVAAAIEAYVTPSSLPTAARIAIGVVAEVAFVLWIWQFGPDADERRRARLYGDGTVGALATAAPAPRARELVTAGRRS